MLYDIPCFRWKRHQIDICSSGSMKRNNPLSWPTSYSNFYGLFPINSGSFFKNDMVRLTLTFTVRLTFDLLPEYTCYRPPFFLLFSCLGRLTEEIFDTEPELHHRLS